MITSCSLHIMKKRGIINNINYCKRKSKSFYFLLHYKVIKYYWLIDKSTERCINKREGNLAWEKMKGREKYTIGLTLSGKTWGPLIVHCIVYFLVYSPSPLFTLKYPEFTTIRREENVGLRRGGAGVSVSYGKRGE